MNNPFFLCHPDKNKSCAACCGLYNYEGFDRAAVAAALRFRADLFNEMKPTGDRLVEYRRIVGELDMRKKLLEEIYTCEFLGFINEDRRCVGCLIHPAVSSGVDMRDFAYYGAETCAEHKCASYNHLTSEEAAPVIEALDDWYLYGQCITDIDLIKEFYAIVSETIFETLKPMRIVGNDAAVESFREYLSLKENWAYRHGQRRFGQYIFEDGKYRVDEIDYHAMGIAKPREARILRSLGSEFRDAAEVRDAVEILRNQIMRVVDSIKK